MDKINYKIGINKIELLEFSFKQVHIDKPTETKFNFDVIIANQPFPESILVQTITLNIREVEKPDEVLVNIHLGIGYTIENFNEVLKINEETRSFEVPIELDLSLKSISISTARGFLFSRLMGTYLHSVILPLIPLPFGEDVDKLAQKRIKNITFTYSEGLNKNEASENSMINSINMWLSPFIKEFNEQGGVVNVLFKADNSNTIAYEGITEDLKKKAKDYLNSFRVK